MNSERAFGELRVKSWNQEQIDRLQKHLDKTFPAGADKHLKEIQPALKKAIHIYRLNDLKQTEKDTNHERSIFPNFPHFP